MSKKKEIVIDGVTYVPESAQKAEKMDGLEYKIIRTNRAGVFAGYLESLDDATAVAIVKKARRLWYWDGAASLSQLAEEGVSKPDKCKFPKEVSKVKLLDVIEVLDCTKEAQENIAGVSVWSG